MASKSPNKPARPPPSPARAKGSLGKAPPPPMDLKGGKAPARKGTTDRPKTKADKAKERAHRREKALSELVETEQTFSHRVGLLIAYYVKPLTDYKIVTADQHAILFPQLEVIKGLSDKFLTELIKRRENWDADSTKLSDLFEDFVPFFRMYQGYVNNHDKAVALMEKLQNKKSVCCVSICVFLCGQHEPKMWFDTKNAKPLFLFHLLYVMLLYFLFFFFFVLETCFTIDSGTNSWLKLVKIQKIKIYQVY